MVEILFALPLLLLPLLNEMESIDGRSRGHLRFSASYLQSLRLIVLL